jgi:hypothetical protein
LLVHEHDLKNLRKCCRQSPLNPIRHATAALTQHHCRSDHQTALKTSELNLISRDGADSRLVGDEPCAKGAKSGCLRFVDAASFENQT